MVGLLSGAAGVYVLQTALTHSDDFSVTDNRVYNFSVGVQCDGTITRALVRGNTITGNTGYGILLCAASTFCDGNTILNGSPGNGIAISATCLNGWCERNHISGGALGITEDVGHTLRVMDNIITGAATPSTGGPYRALGNVATPDVTNARFASTANTTSITNFANGTVGQVLTVKALASITLVYSGLLRLSGSVNYAMTSGATVTLFNDGNWVEVGRSS
jgi:hypothetical protein